MSFPRYEGYKDSGVEWLGEVPEHWEASRFSRVILAIKDGTHGTFHRVKDGAVLLSAKNVANGRIEVSDDESIISYEDYKYMGALKFLMMKVLFLMKIINISYRMDSLEKEICS